MITLPKTHIINIIKPPISTKPKKDIKMIKIGKNKNATLQITNNDNKKNKPTRSSFKINALLYNVALVNSLNPNSFIFLFDFSGYPTGHYSAYRAGKCKKHRKNKTGSNTSGHAYKREQKS